MEFSHIKYRGSQRRRIYTADSHAEASSFAHRFGGFYWKFTEDSFYVII